MSEPSALENKAQESGMRMTEQRRVIARVLAESDDHPDVEEVHRRSVEMDAAISPLKRVLTADSSKSSLTVAISPKVRMVPLS